MQFKRKKFNETNELHFLSVLFFFVGKCVTIRKDHKKWRAKNQHLCCCSDVDLNYAFNISRNIVCCCGGNSSRIFHIFIHRAKKSIGHEECHIRLYGFSGSTSKHNQLQNTLYFSCIMVENCMLAIDIYKL